MKRLILFIYSVFILLSSVKAQETPTTIHPVTDEPCPDFTLTDVQYYPKKQVSLKDFKGKWLILDFWNKGCGACIRNFPHYNKLQQQFKDKVQILLVGFTGTVNHHSDNKEIRALYEGLRRKESLNLSVAFDSLIFNKWNILSGPLAIIISPEGMVKGIVYTATEDLLDNMIAGKINTLPKYMELRYWDEAPPYNPDLPFLTSGTNINGINDTAFLYRSLLMKWNDKCPGAGDDNFDRLNKKNQFQIAGCNLLNLYCYAYLGIPVPLPPTSNPDYENMYRSVILEIKDSSLFKSNLNTRENLFVYSLTVPQQDANKEKMMKIMQSDLSHYFPFEARLEQRPLPYLRLVVTDQKKAEALKSRGIQNSKYKDKLNRDNKKNYGFLMIDVPIKKLISGLQESNVHNIQSPIINETGIDFNIDIYLDCFFEDFEAQKRELRKNGLDLIEGTKNLKVLVIKDAH